MKNIIFFACFFFTFSTQIYSQPDCLVGSDQSSDPFECDTGDITAFDNNYFNFLQNPVNNQPYNIPVIFHVLEEVGGDYISDTQILDELFNVNQIFGNILLNGTTSPGIQFHIASSTELGTCFNGILRHQVDEQHKTTDFNYRHLYQIDPENICNVYIVENGTDGAASLPYYLNCGRSEDGIAVNSWTFTNNNNTLAHEFGHYLGLYHLRHVDIGSHTCNQCRGYDDPNDPNDDDFCFERGDRVCDTAPAYLNTVGPSCDGPPILDECPNICDNVTDQGFLIEKNNVMGGYKACREGFTVGQAQRMYYSLDEYREELWNNNNGLCQNLSINTDFTFGSGTYYLDDINISGGAVVTIPDNVTIKFCADNSINITEGSTLVLRGNLTNSCDNLWDGINVSGPGSKLLSNEATIENAFLGVSIKNNGYCSAISTHFLNNSWGVEVNSNSNGGDFEDCSFEVDDNLVGNNFSYHMRIISNSSPVHIRGGCFHNTFNQGTGTAINSYNGNFTVAPSYDYNKFGDFDGTNKVRFDGFHSAINASNGITHSYQVENAIFNKNNFAIQNNEVNASKLTFNEFNIDDDQVGVLYYGPTVGIINQENNYIGVSDNLNVGVLSHSIGVMNNTLRRNTFENLEVGCLANGLNGETGIFGPSGLTFICNTNHQVEFDHAVTPAPIPTINQIRPVQGDFVSSNIINATGNIVHYNSVPGSDFFNLGDLEVEYHSRDITNELLLEKLFVQEKIEPINNYDCDQTTFIDFPPIIGIPNGPGFPTTEIGIKQFIDSIHGTTGPFPYIAYQQEEWDHFLPFLLNEVLTMNQDFGYSDFLNPYQFNLPSHDLNVVSWLSGHSLEGDLSIIRILLDNNQNSIAQNFINGLNSEWSSHPQVSSISDDYTDILTEVGAQSIYNLSPSTLAALINNNYIRTVYGKTMIRSIAQLYDVYIPISYSLPNSGPIAPRNTKSDKQFLVYPNPFSETIIIEAPSEAAINIYDLLGRKMFSAKLDKGENSLIIPNLEIGLIFFQINSGDEILSSGKLIKM